MTVEFRATNLFDTIPVNEQIRACYETVIMSFVDQVGQNIDVSKLAAIIIPENFVSEVISFQKSIGEKLSVTKNEHAEALGKVTVYQQVFCYW